MPPRKSEDRRRREEMASPSRTIAAAADPSAAAASTPVSNKQKKRAHQAQQDGGRIDQDGTVLAGFSWVPHGGMAMVPTRTVSSRRGQVDASEEQVDNEGDGDGDDDDDAELKEDPLLQMGRESVLQGVESDDDSELDDITFRETDLVFVCGRSGEEPSLELYVYDDPKSNIYLHHDAPLISPPVSTAWLTDGSASMCAVSSLKPFVEIWNLDDMNSADPILLLGGCVASENNARKTIKAHMLKPESHRDAVCCVRWNTLMSHILATASADATVKFWDLHSGDCSVTSRESDRVQSIDWHPADASILATGTFNGQLTIRDGRLDAASNAVAAWNAGTGGAVECVKWHPASAGSGSGAVNTLLVSTSAGQLAAVDPRLGSNSAPIWSLAMHGGDTCFDVSRHAPLLAAGGKDNQVSVWELLGPAGSHGPPRLLGASDMGIGAAFSVAFHPNVPTVVGACGTAGIPLVYALDVIAKDVFLAARAV